MSCLTVLSRTSVAASMRPLSMDPDRSTMKATSRGFSTSLLTTLDDPKAEKVAWKTPPGRLGRRRWSPTCRSTHGRQNGC